MNTNNSLLTIIVFLFISFLSFTVLAQQTQPSLSGKISGKIVDSVSSQSIEFATITVSRQDNNKVVKGLSSDKNGLFSIAGIPDGKFKVSISFVGYKTIIRNNINISKNHPNASLGTISMVEERTDLKEVVVTSNRIVIEDKGDKTVYNVERDITSQSGVAADVLKKVPQVSVDVNGNVELQGNSNVRFLIDGKPSVIFGNNIADVLQSIPASQIKNIEVITSQGAKEDAEGTGGVINIILKKSTAEGINGNVSITGGTRLQNGSFNLNAHHRNFGANAFVNGNAMIPSTTLSSSNRTIDSLNHNKYISQLGSSIYSRQGFQSGVGLNWDISQNDNMSASYGLNYLGYNGNGPTNDSTIDANQNIIPLSNKVINSNTKYHTQSMQWGINYKHKFDKEDQKLEASYLQSFANNYNYYQESQNYYHNDTIFEGSRAINPGTQKETDFTLDYAHPVNKSILIETGAKVALIGIMNTTNDYESQTQTQSDTYIFDSRKSMTFDYNSKIYAAYLSGKFKLFHLLDIKVGGRYEYTDINATSNDTSKVAVKSYGTFVPSLLISHTFPRKRTVKISYTRRIQRPNYNDLNPFYNVSNPTGITTGNPLLTPEIGNKIELGYSKSYEKGANITLNLFYQGNKDDIQSYTQSKDSIQIADVTYRSVTITSRENVGHENNYGVNLFASIPIMKKINVRTNISGFERFIDVGSLSGGNIQGFNYRINMNASYEVSKSLVVEFFGNFNSPRVNVQGKMPSFTTYNFALRKQFFDGKASIALSATNPFNKYVVQKTELTGVNFTLNSERDLPFRSFGINLSYKFGKLEFKQDKSHDIDDSNLNNPPMGN
jgi:outer membrane receptor protein involved in Fe transport